MAKLNPKQLQEKMAKNPPPEFMELVFLTPDGEGGSDETTYLCKRDTSAFDVFATTMGLMQGNPSDSEGMLTVISLLVSKTLVNPEDLESFKGLTDFCPMAVASEAVIDGIMGFYGVGELTEIAKNVSEPAES